MNALIVILPALPVLAALANHLLAPSRGTFSARLSVTFGGGAFALALGLLVASVMGEPSRVVGDAVHGGSLFFDPLSLLLATVVTGIALIVRLYSVRYMAEEAGYRRYFVLLDLMVGTLLVMVAAADLLTLMVAWHLIGVLLYFLLGHDMQSGVAHRYASWTALTYRIGDLPLVLAAVLAYQAFGTWSLHDLFDAIAAAPDREGPFGLPLADTLAALVAFSAFARSAQFLVHTWLPYTMSGPTPVSALMHAGIVNAGGFLLNRFAPLLVYTPAVLHWVFIVGLVTAVIGSVLMLTQNDIKKSLGYSTMGQMGFMIMEIGVGAFSLAVFHLIAHGLFKGTLFLGAGSVIGDARKNDGVPSDDLYTFVVERRPSRHARPWLAMATVGLLLPLVVLGAAHWIIAEDFLQKQGVVILLIFGWLAGAQLVFATHRLQSEQPYRALLLVLLSFALVVFGYTLVSHMLDTYLYPDPVFRERVFAAAGIDLFWFDVLVALLAAAIVTGWLRIYRLERDALAGIAGRHSALWLNFYALVSREFYVADVYARVARAIIGFAARLNVWLRWV